MDMITCNIFTEEHAMAIAKAMAAAGLEIEAIKIVRQMVWLPLKKIGANNYGLIPEYNTLVSSKKFIESGFILPPYVPAVGDTIYYLYHEMEIHAIHDNEAWLYIKKMNLHRTFKLSDIIARAKNI